MSFPPSQTLEITTHNKRKHVESTPEPCQRFQVKKKDNILAVTLEHQKSQEVAQISLSLFPLTFHYTQSNLRRPSKEKRPN
ncbi:hypothetical protein EJB05_53941, partial [Eragrostis curvula]